jgi:hypothetical protein
MPMITGKLTLPKLRITTHKGKKGLVFRHPTMAA